jgi:hypothetical protein
MHYSDGQEMHVGDRMGLWDGSEGMVVCSIDTQEYSPDYPGEHWACLARGVLICPKSWVLFIALKPKERCGCWREARDYPAEIILPEEPMRGVR